MKTLFLDLDGVMADFDGYFTQRFGVSPLTFPANSPDMWKLINQEKDFFYNIPAMSGAQQFYRDLIEAGLYPNILTACPHSDYAGVADQKKRWVRNRLGDHLLVIPTYGSSTKPLFLQHPGDVLIDDWDKNCKAWNEAGGYAIQYKGSFVNVWDELMEQYEYRDFV